MLHPINPPTCISELEALIGLQQKMLDFAVANSTYSEAAFRSAVGDDFVNWLLSISRAGGKVAKPVNSFFQELGIYLRFPGAEKNQILQDFISDQTYYQRISDNRFSFSLLPSKSASYTSASTCLIKFYEFLGIGYPLPLVGHPAGASAFKKVDVINGYKASNADIEYVCPCCDQTFTDSPGSNEEGYTLDHFFPKSLYPSICLHPLNLVPMCSGCNNRKGEIDPLNPTSIPAISVSYNESFHPLARPVRQHANLSFQARSSPPDAMMFVSHNPSPTYQNSIAAYKILYQIPDRWETNWKRVDRQVSSYLQRALRRLNTPLIDQPLFDSALQDAITELEGDVGQNHLCYPAVKWLSWARVNKFQDLMQSFVPS